MNSLNLKKIAKRLTILAFEIEDPELARIIKRYIKDGYEVDFSPSGYSFLPSDPSVQTSSREKLYPVVRKKDIYPWTKITNYYQTQEDLKELEDGMDALYSYLDENGWEILRKEDYDTLLYLFHLLAEKDQYRISFSIYPYPTTGSLTITSTKYPKGTSRIPTNDLFSESFGFGESRRGDTIQTAIFPILKKLDKLEEEKLETQKKYDYFYKSPEQIIHSDLIHYSDDPIPVLQTLSGQKEFRRHDELNIEGLSTTYSHGGLKPVFSHREFKMVFRPNPDFKAFVLDEEGYFILQHTKNKTGEFLKGGYDAIIFPFGGYSGKYAWPSEDEQEEFEVLIIKPNSIKVKEILNEDSDDVTSKFIGYAPELFSESSKINT